MENYFRTKIDGIEFKNENLKKLLQIIIDQELNPKDYVFEEYSEFQEKFFPVSKSTIDNYVKFLKPVKKPIVIKQNIVKKENTVKVQMGESNLLLVLNKKHKNQI